MRNTPETTSQQEKVTSSMHAQAPQALRVKGTKEILMGLVLAAGMMLTQTVMAGYPELPVILGTAGDFVILTKSGISTTGTTAITGDIGVSPIAATAITGFGLIMDGSNTFSTSSLVTGKVYAANYAPPTPAKMTTAVSNMETAYTDAAGRAIPDHTELGAGNITSMNLAPGLYKWSTGVLVSAAGVTLTGNATDVWIFQIAQTLTVASGATVTLSGGAQASNVFWQVAGQTTLGTTSSMKGIILCQTAIVMQTGASLNGRALAQTAVTLDANGVSLPQQNTPGIHLVKTANPASIQSGDPVTYTYRVTNPGNVSLSSVTVTDDQPGVTPAYFSGDTNANNLLDPGEIWIFTATANPTQTVTNTGTAHATDDAQDVLTATDQATVTIVTPGIHMVKEPKNTLTHSGDAVPYAYTVTNTGNAPLSSVTVTDNQPGVNPAYVSGDTNTNGLLDVTETWIFTATAHPTSNVTNIGTAGGTDALQTRVTATAEATVTVITPGIHVVKSANPTPIHSGDLVTYTYTVTNTGDTPLHIVTVTDDQAGVTPVYVSGDTNSDLHLDPGEIWIYTATATPTATVTNTGTASGFDALQTIVTATVQATVTVITPGIHIVKSADLTPIHSGGLVTYTYTVTNTGDTPLHVVTVTDNQAGVTPAYVSGDTNTNGLLDLTETWIFTATAHPTATVTNTGTAHGTDELGKEFTDTAQATVTVIHPAIHIVKTASPTSIQSGDLVTYTYSVTNTGDVPLSNVTVTDDQVGVTPVYVSGDSNSNGLLDLTETWIFRATANPTQSVTNIGTAHGTDELQRTVTATDTATVTIRPKTGCYNSQAFKGTVTLKVNWLNNGAPTNCDAWDNLPQKYDMFLVLCYAPVECPQCPIDIVDMHMWIVNKNAKPVEIWENGGPDLVNESELIGLGGDGISLLTFIDFIPADPSIPLTGKRKDKQTSPGVFSTTISGLDGLFGRGDVNVNQDLTCSADDQIVYGSVSLTNFKVKLPGADCPTCVSCQNCDLYIGAIQTYLEKKYPTADWLSPAN